MSWTAVGGYHTIATANAGLTQSNAQRPLIERDDARVCGAPGNGRRRIPFSWTADDQDCYILTLHEFRR